MLKNKAPRLAKKIWNSFIPSAAFRTQKSDKGSKIEEVRLKNESEIALQK